MKNKQKGFVIPILAAIIALLVIGGVTYIYVNNKSLNKYSADVSGISATNQTSNWKTYTNAKYGFEFQYPENWVSSISDSGISLTTPENAEQNKNNQSILPPVFDFSIGYTSNDWFIKNAKSLTGKEFTNLKNFLKDTYGNVAEINIDGKKAYSTIVSTSKYDYLVYIDTGKNTYIILSIPCISSEMLSPTLDPKNPKITTEAKNIMSTFKFITSTDQTANWKTYTNAQYGFELKYPAGSKISDSDTTGGRTISIQLPVSGKNNLFGKDLRISIVDQQYGKNEGSNVTFVPADCGSDTFYNYKTSDVVINGINFKKGDVSGAFGGMQSASNATEYCVMNGDKSFRLISLLTFQRYSKLPTFNVDDETKVLNQIISTFKFTTPADLTAGWKTYTNTQYEFEVKYPEKAVFETGSAMANSNWYKIKVPSISDAEAVITISFPKSEMCGSYGPGVASVRASEEIVFNNKKYNFGGWIEDAENYIRWAEENPQYGGYTPRKTDPNYKRYYEKTMTLCGDTFTVNYSLSFKNLSNQNDLIAVEKLLNQIISSFKFTN